jgi:hypothetical protein
MVPSRYGVLKNAYDRHNQKVSANGSGAKVVQELLKIVDSLLLDQIAGVLLLFGVGWRLFSLHPFILSVGHPATWPVRVATDGLECVGALDVSCCQHAG